MKIVYIYNSLAVWGGVERIFVDKMNYLADVYHEDIYMFTYNQGNHQIPFQLSPRVHYEDLGVNTHHQYHYTGLRKYWERYVRQSNLRRLVTEKFSVITPDVIVTSTAGLSPMLLDIKGKAKLVIESHSGYHHVLEFERMTWKHRLEQKRCFRMLKKTDVLVTLTESDAECWRSLKLPVKVIPNVVHLNVSGCYSTLEQKQVIFVGRFAKQKAVPDLLKIWNIVYQRHPDWQLAMYGEGEHKQTLMKDIVRLDANIVVHEPTPYILDRFKECSIFVLTSLYEPFGLVIPEAMSCGLPVVSFEGDGPCSIINDGKDGFIVKDRNVHAFADRVCQLIENKELRRRMGQQAILTAQNYSANKIMPQWKQLFESLTNNSLDNHGVGSTN